MRERGVSAASLSTRVASKCVPSVLMSPERLTCVRMRWDERVAMWQGCVQVCERMRWTRPARICARPFVTHSLAVLISFTRKFAMLVFF